MMIAEGCWVLRVGEEGWDEGKKEINEVDERLLVGTSGFTPSRVDSGKK